VPQLLIDLVGCGHGLVRRNSSRGVSFCGIAGLRIPDAANVSSEGTRHEAPCLAANTTLQCVVANHPWRVVSADPSSLGLGGMGAIIAPWLLPLHAQRGKSQKG
jgi:hypothetical protein